MNLKYILFAGTVFALTGAAFADAPTPVPAGEPGNREDIRFECRFRQAKTKVGECRVMGSFNKKIPRPGEIVIGDRDDFMRVDCLNNNNDNDHDDRDRDDGIAWRLVRNDDDDHHHGLDTIFETHPGHRAEILVDDFDWERAEGFFRAELRVRSHLVKGGMGENRIDGDCEFRKRRERD